MATPSIGDIVYLASCAIRLGVSAATTYPDTPNQYSASFKLMGDKGVSLDAVAGPQGPNGQAVFALREITDLNVNAPEDLPVLTNTVDDIGKYYLIDELDDQGHVLTTWCYIWWGHYYRQIMMGVVGPPGPVPEIGLDIQAIDPSLPPQILTSGGSLAPTWEFLVPSPIGPQGPIGPLHGFQDFDEIDTPPTLDNVIAYTGNVTEDGFPLWAPFNLEQYLPQLFSMPSAQFNSFSGVSQQAPIGGMTLPAQPFPWTPLVWGHLAVGGLSLGRDPLMVGAQVLMGNQTSGQQIARGIGNTLGEVNISPHYSTRKSPNTNISPKNGLAVIPAGQPLNLYVNLWNDGQLGFYNFSPEENRHGFQGLLDDLTDALGNPVATIRGTVGLLEHFVGSIPHDVQIALDSVQNLIGGFNTSSVVQTIDGIPVVGQIVGAGLQDVAHALNYFDSLANNLANALGISNIISEISSVLSSFEQEITSGIQNAVDAIANQFGFSGTSQPLDLVSSALNSLQPAIQQLTDVLSGNWIPNIQSLLAQFIGPINSVIRDALDAITGALGQGTGFGIGGVGTILGGFQSRLDGLAGALGLSGVGHTITDVLFNLVPHIFGVVAGPIQTIIFDLIHFLGHSPIGGPIGDIVKQLIDLLLKLTGNLSSYFTTDAQLFVMVLPMLQ